MERSCRLGHNNLIANKNLLDAYKKATESLSLDQAAKSYQAAILKRAMQRTFLDLKD